MNVKTEDLSVTAVIPCYNGSRFIGEAIEHMLNQTRAPDEVIVVDDGSTDGSYEIIRGYTQVKVIRHTRNLGLPAARNNAWQAARGDIIVYVDVDAYAESGLIENILAEYTSEKIGGVGGAGYEVRSDNAPNLWRGKYLSQNLGPERVENPEFLYGICSSYRKSVLQELGGFDPLFATNGEDVDLSIRVRQKGYTLVYTPYAEVRHHRNDSIVTLAAMIYRWWRWGHYAHLKNKVPYLRLHLKQTIMMFRWIMKTSLNDRDWKLIPVNLVFLFMGIRGILAARLDRMSSPSQGQASKSGDYSVRETAAPGPRNIS